MLTDNRLDMLSFTGALPLGVYERPSWQLLRTPVSSPQRISAYSLMVDIVRYTISGLVPVFSMA